MTQTPRIEKLSSDVISQIAAGEVVERPSMVVKELVENALDAGAKSVTVALTEGGLTAIRVTDNGSGIPTRDLRMAFERHATSKLRQAEELFHVGSLGFRGEALAAISAVSKVTMTTRTKDDEAGARVVNHAGQILSITPVAASVGTAILVEDLFYNVPVRLSFLRRPALEAREVASLMNLFILARPDVAFRLSIDNKTIAHSRGDGLLTSALIAVYGADTMAALVPVDGHQAGVLLSGYVGVGESARGNRQHEHFFVNGRLMRSGLLSQALEEAVKTRVMIGRFPLCALSLTLPTDKVDVNVHPNKWEMRFADEKGVYEAVVTLVREAVNKGILYEQAPALFEPAPSKPGAAVTTVTQAEPLEILTVAPSPAPQETPAPSPQPEPERTESIDWAKLEARAPAPVFAPPVEAEQLTASAPYFDSAALRLVGRLWNSYLIFETEDSFYLFDQHALHERLLYDSYMAKYLQGGHFQPMLSPLALTLDAARMLTFTDNRQLLSRAGFDAEPFGDNTVRLQSLPLFLGEPEAAQRFIDALDSLSETGRLSEEQRVNRLITAACKRAVKAGEALDQAEVMALVSGVLNGNVVPTCPHGRPLMIKMTEAELEKRFKRRQE